MYAYAFTRFNGSDKVFTLPADLKVAAGDLLRLGSEFFLCLGKDISFSELYHNAPVISSPSLEVIYTKFLSKKTLALLHWMVETYYTTYKSVIKHFVTDELEKLLEREHKSIKSKVHKVCKVENFSIAENGQTLIVFPDLRTLTNECGNVEELKSGNMSLLLASQTEKQKAEHRWEIKKGIQSVIFCTYAEIFQDFKDLQKIIRVDPHKRYYANQQDPRYKVGEVLKKMAQLRGAELESVGI